MFSEYTEIDPKNSGFRFRSVFDDATANVTTTPHHPDRSKTIELQEKLWLQGIIAQISDSEDGKILPQHHLEDIRRKLGGLIGPVKYENIEAVIADFDFIIEDTLDTAGDETPTTARARRIRADLMERLDAGNLAAPPTEESKKRPHSDTRLHSESSDDDSQPSATRPKTSTA